MSLRILQGDALEQLRTLPAESAQCCVSSPPYWGLRSYLPENHPNKPREIGMEKTPEEFVAKLVTVFREVRRILKPDGTLWVNTGDCYATGAGAVGECPGGGEQGEKLRGSRGGHEGKHAYSEAARGKGPMTQPNRMPLPGLKPKDLVGVPWMLAFALRADGWYLRKDIIWGKPNGMPESTKDRPCSAHEYVFLLSKQERYFYDYDAVRLPALPPSIARLEQHVEMQMVSSRANAGGKTNGTMKAVTRKSDKQRGHSRRHDGFNDRWDGMTKQQQQQNGAALRSVWWIAPAQTKDGHFAVMPDNLAATCILAGSKPGDTILDPFGGSGTTSRVALHLGRSAVTIDLNPEYLPLIERRCAVTPGLGI